MKLYAVEFCPLKMWRKHIVKLKTYLANPTEQQLECPLRVQIAYMQSDNKAQHIRYVRQYNQPNQLMYSERR